MSYRGAFGQVVDLLRGHAAFFLPYMLFLLLGGVALALMEQGDAIFLINGNRSAGLDDFFRYVTLLGEGFFFVVAAGLLVFLAFRYAVVLPALGLMVFLLAQVSKRIFAHPRPFAYFREQGLTDQILPIEGVDVYTGMNSFPSGHTMTAFALFTFLALCTPYKRLSGLLFFILAVLVGLSRIYLLHHFLKDVYLGSLMGVLLGIAIFVLAEYLPASRFPWLDKSLVLSRSGLTLRSGSRPT